MRTAKVATALALGALLSLTIVAMPVQAGCSSLVAQPTGCLTAIYNSAKANVAAKASGAGAWASFAPVYLSACPAVPTVGIDLPGLPAADSVVVYTSDLQDALEGFQGGVAVSLFPATAALIQDSSEATVGLIVFYSDEMDQIVMPILLSDVPDSPDDLPTLPTLPDPSGGLEELGGYAEENAGSLQQGAEASLGCVQGLPPP